MKTQLFTLNQTTSIVLLNRWWLRVTLLLLLIICFSSIALGQTKLWNKTIGGNSQDQLASLKQTSDGGYILGGTSSSDKNGDKTETSRGGDDYWIVKLNADGTKAWDKTFGGNGQDQLASLQQTSDGGYVLGGYSLSNKSGDKTEASKGDYDYWIVKLNADGSKAWDKTIGGNNDDRLASLQQTSDGGYILGGTSNSGKSGDKTEDSIGAEYYSTDYWIVKLNADGSKTWDKTIGGDSYDLLASLQQTSDGGYILGGSSNSNKGGDKTENAKGCYQDNEDGEFCLSDYWVVKLDLNGTKTWDRTIGGNGNDILMSLRQVADGGLILGGNSDSGIGGDKTEDGRGGRRMWQGGAANVFMTIGW